MATTYARRHVHTHTHTHTHTPEVQVFEVYEKFQVLRDYPQEVSIETELHKLSKVADLLRDMVKPITGEIYREITTPVIQGHTCNAYIHK